MIETFVRIAKQPNMSQYFNMDIIEQYCKYYKILEEPSNNMNNTFTFCKDDPCVDRVVHKFLRRSNAGMQKYKTSLEANKKPTLSWINDAQEEAMDFILYLERLKTDIKDMDNKLNAGHYFDE